MFIPEPFGREVYDLIVVDEISMLPKTMWELLLSHNVPVIALGDPEQLPPVDANEDNHVLEHPHIFLDEIMRQAQESEIIRLSMHVREGKPIKSFQAMNEQVMIASKKELSLGMLNWADQVLCATNATRNGLNNFIRQAQGKTLEPVIGDKIICLRNHWDIISQQGNWPLTNGLIGTITSCKDNEIIYPKNIVESRKIYTYDVNFDLEDRDCFKGLILDKKALIDGEESLNPKQRYALSRKKMFVPYNFAYANVITTWKAQGSEFDKVLLFEEKFPFSKKEHRQYLYTGITRGREKVVVITK